MHTDRAVEMPARRDHHLPFDSARKLSIFIKFTRGDDGEERKVNEDEDENRRVSWTSRA